MYYECVRDIIHRSYKLQINASDQIIPSDLYRNIKSILLAFFFTSRSTFVCLLHFVLLLIYFQQIASFPCCSLAAVTLVSFVILISLSLYQWSNKHKKNWFIYYSLKTLSFMSFGFFYHMDGANSNCYILFVTLNSLSLLL